MKGHILLAYRFDGIGGGEPLIGDAVAMQTESEKLTWVHIDASHPDAGAWLEKEIAYLDPFIIKALLADETRPRVTPIGDGALLILRGVNLNRDASPEDMVSIRLWVDKCRIISVRKRTLRAVWDISDKIQAGEGPKDTGQFVAMLASGLFERMEPVLMSLDEKTDMIEAQVLESACVTLREDIIQIRKMAIIFRRFLAPQRDAINHLRHAELDWLHDRDKRQLQEAYNHVTRYVEDLDAVRERSQIVKDELANILTDRLNKNMYILSLIAAIFLPLGFLTGLLGINVGGIPGANNIYAFFIFCTLLIGIIVAQIVLFRKLKWF